MNRLTPSTASLSCALALLAAFPAFSDEHAAEQRLGNDVFASGAEVRLAEPVSGDAVLAGREITVEERTTGDMVAAGARVRLQGAVGEDLYAAGGEVRVAAPVAGSARIAGGHVEITDEANIEDGASIAGGDVEIDGRIGPYAQIAGGKIRIGGHVAGNVEASGGELSVSPNAVIDGALRFHGPNPPTVAQGAQIRGGVQHIEDDSAVSGRTFVTFAGIVWMLGWLLVGILLIALAPRATRAAAETIRERPWRSLLLGFVLLIIMPVAIALVAVTLVGIPLALVLVCAYLLLLAVGYLFTVISISDSMLARLRGAKPSSTGMRILAFVVASVIVYLLLQIPFAGNLIAFLVILFGMGGIALRFFSRRQTSAPAH